MMKKAYRIVAWLMSWIAFGVLLDPTRAFASYQYNGAPPTPQERMQEEMHAMMLDLTQNIQEAVDVYNDDAADVNMGAYTPEEADDILAEDQGDIDAASGAADGFAGFMQDMNMGAQVRRPFQDGS